MERLSLPAARRVAIAAAGLSRRNAAAPDQRRILLEVRRLGLLQIDSVNVLVRAHYLPLFSRMGAYPRERLEGAAWERPKRLFEYWAHEASLLPVEAQPLFRWRMAAAASGVGVYQGLARYRREAADRIEAVFAEVEQRGPIPAADLEGARGRGGWWGWSDAKRALEWLFWAGRLTTATRRGAFERVYDLPERVLPPSVLDAPTPDPADAHRALIAHAARALGVATAGDLRDYFRLPPAAFNPRLPELVEAGVLIPVVVEGWSRPAFVHAEARRPRRVDAHALLAPFDPLIWRRERAERLFEFRYRIEIYTPAEKRTHGYYVLPFLLGDRLVARVDLKSERGLGLLRVQSAWGEPHAPAHTADALATELQAMAGWLGLERVVVEDRGDLAAALTTASVFAQQPGDRQGLR